jgi:hypothetical protein
MQRRINLTAAGTTALVVAAAIGLGGCDILGPRPAPPSQCRR